MKATGPGEGREVGRTVYFGISGTPHEQNKSEIIVTRDFCLGSRF